jgi:hypothetical protein
MHMQKFIKGGPKRSVAILATLVVFSFLTGSTAHAAANALIAFSSKTFNPAFASYGVIAQAGTVNSHASVMVGTTAGTPNVSWAAGEFSGAFSGTFGPYTQYGYPTITSFRSNTHMLQSGMLGVDPAAVAGSVNPSTVATTSCVVPGSCFASHGGTLMQSPGAKKFGGSAHLLRNSRFESFVLSSVLGGFANLSGTAMAPNGPPAKSDVNIRGYTYRLNTSPAFPVPVYGELQSIQGGIYATGMGTHMKTNPVTTTTMVSGSHMLNPTNLTGTISVVVPRMGYTNITCRDFFDDVAPGKQTSGSPDGLCDYDGLTLVAFNGVLQDLGGYREIKLTFLPEPSSIAMVGAGILALAGAARLRRRS